ncbi:MAG TPA: hypothetical protein VHO66_04065, partial [Ruminiclostridium sp.]|nr:hypothetical protein [Ruminiclostridium sp.]
CKHLSAPFGHARLENTGIRSAINKFHASQPVFLRFACSKLPACSRFKTKRSAPVFARGFDVSLRFKELSGYLSLSPPISGVRIG